MKSLQEAYETVRAHLLSQNEKCQDSWQCVYRGSNGMKCAIGVLLTDEAVEEYNLLKMNRAADDANVQLALRASGWECPDNNFYQQLQAIHDTFDPDHWKEELKFFAIEHNLIP